MVPLLFPPRFPLDTTDPDPKVLYVVHVCMYVNKTLKKKKELLKNTAVRKIQERRRCRR